MAVQAIDNAGLIGYCFFNCNIADFNPVLTYTYNAGTGALVVTDASTFPAGDSFSKVKIKLHDEFGNEVRGVITTAGGSVTISGVTLDKSEPLNVTATVLSTNNLASDGSAWNIQAAGNVGHFDSKY